jgi:hypothetical protein
MAARSIVPSGRQNRDSRQACEGPRPLSAAIPRCGHRGMLSGASRNENQAIGPAPAAERLAPSAGGTVVMREGDLAVCTMGGPLYYTAIAATLFVRRGSPTQ